MGVSIPLTIHSDENKGVAFLPSPIDVLTNDSSKEQIKEAINFVSEEYGLDNDGLYRLILCESSLNPYSVGDSGKARNLAQFHKPTFDHFCSGEYDNAKDQLICLAQMLKNGLGSHWTCLYAYYE